jgi:hypothetical protein
MKTLKSLDDAHNSLTILLSELAALASKTQEAVNALLKASVILSTELLSQTESFIEENKHLGFATREEFVTDAVRFRLNWLRSGSQFLEIPREDYDKLSEALKELNAPFEDGEDFINSQIRKILENYEKYRNDRK